MLAATSTPSRAMLRAPQLRALLRRPAGASASAPPVPLATWRAGRASRLQCSAASDGGRTVTTVDPTKAKEGKGERRQMIDLQPPKGTRDFPPEEMRVRNWLFGHFREVARTFGFDEFDAPVLETEDLYVRKAGEEITQQLYNFEDKGGRRVALRPELTPSFARLILQQGKSLALPAKWFAVGQCWRYERMTRGRRREHYQWNMDIIGCAGIAAEVELLSAIVQFFKAIGITHEDIGIKVNSRKVMASVLKAMGVTDDKFAPVCVVMDKMDKIGPEETKKELVATQGLDAETAEKIVSCLLCKSVDDLAALCGDGVDTTGVDELKRLFELAADYGFGDWLVFDASVVRGLAYYTGVVFEGFDRAGELRAICGGGRYDRLLSLYGAVTEVPACGFGFGDCVVVELLKDKGILPNLPKSVDFVVAAFNESMQGAAMKTTALMRDGGAQVDLLLEPKKKVANTFDYANRAGARYIVFVAPAEWEKGTVRVKDLRLGEETPDEEKQIDVKLEDLGRVREVLDAWALARGVGKVAV